MHTGGVFALSLRARVMQVHYYIRAIQMEQLQQQDLNADMKQMGEEVARATLDAKGGQPFTTAQRSKVCASACFLSLFSKLC